MLYLYTNWKTYVASIFQCQIETEGLFKVKVTGSHVHCNSRNISETVQDRDIVNTDY